MQQKLPFIDLQTRWGFLTAPITDLDLVPCLGNCKAATEVNIFGLFRLTHRFLSTFSSRDDAQPRHSEPLICSPQQVRTSCNSTFEVHCKLLLSSQDRCCARRICCKMKRTWPAASVEFVFWCWTRLTAFLSPPLRRSCGSLALHFPRLIKPSYSVPQ